MCVLMNTHTANSILVVYGNGVVKGETDDSKRTHTSRQQQLPECEVILSASQTRLLTIYLSSKPLVLTIYLSSQPFILTIYLSYKPFLLTIYLSSKPLVLTIYLSSQPFLLTIYLSSPANPNGMERQVSWLRHWVGDHEERGSNPVTAITFSSVAIHFLAVPVPRIPCLYGVGGRLKIP